MKTWEMFKALTEDPKLKFSNGCHTVGISDKTKTVVWILKTCEEEPFIIYANAPIIDNLHIEWDQIRQPVDFMTAVNSGKKIRPVDHTIDGFLKFNQWGLNLEMINGLWIVE